MSEKDGGPAFPHLKPMFRYGRNVRRIGPELVHTDPPFPFSVLVPTQAAPPPRSTPTRVAPEPPPHAWLPLRFGQASFPLSYFIPDRLQERAQFNDRKGRHPCHHQRAVCRALGFT